MPSNVTYSSPSATQPNLQNLDYGPMGGLMFMDQVADHRQMMGVQHFLQQLGAQRAEQEQAEFMGGAPLRALKGKAETEDLEGKMPFLRQLAGATAQTNIAGQNFQRETQFSPQAKEDFFRKLKQGASDDQWKNYGREMQAGHQLVNEAVTMAGQRGQLAAQAYVQQQLQTLQQKGITLPAQFADPNNWESILQASRESIEHWQKVDIENVKGSWRAYEQELQNTGLEKRQVGERNQNLDQNMAHLMNLIRQGKATPADKSAFEQHVFRKWGERMGQRADLQLWNMQAADPGPQGVAAKKLLQEAQDEFFQGYGLRPKKDTSGKPKGKTDAEIIQEAQTAIARGADKEAVRQRLESWGLKLP